MTATMTYHPIHVAAVRRLTPHMTRISFLSDDLRSFSPAGPDQYVKVFFPLPGQSRPTTPPPADPDGVLSWYRTYLAMPDDVRPPMRTYTIRGQRPEDGQIDIDFVLHGDTGPASRWALQAQPGDEVAFLYPPHALYVPSSPDWQLLVGDETAVPAIGAIIEELPPEVPVRALIEVDDADDEQLWDTRCKDLRVTWVHRAGRPHGEAVLEALRELEFPEGEPYAWLSGEAGMVKLARRHLVRERSVDKRAITFTGYWRVGQSEEDTGRENVRKLEAGETPADDL
ncbi:siderophore-interacting protein [Amycolatopsis suaedae]|nr:siderophore-interacting protein [Amycolatopsis suaedae]